MCAAAQVVLRQLKGIEGAERRIVDERIEQFVDMLFREQMGRNHVIPLEKVLFAAIGQLSSATSYAKDKEVVVDDLERLFCSKTVAVAYKAAGLLAPNRVGDKFLPKHFSSGYDAFLDLQGGAHLGPPTHVTFESRRMHDAVSFLLAHPLLEMLADPLGTGAREGKAALLVQKFVRRLAARRELRRRKERGDDGGDVGEKQALYDGATRVGTNERTKLLRRKSLEPRNRPQETIQAGVSDLV